MDNKSSIGKPTNTPFERKISRARRVMLMEQIWPRLWLPLAVIILFILVSTFGLWPTLPLPAHLVALGVFAAGLLASLAPLFETSVAPIANKPSAGWKKKSGLAHRPATVLDDDLSDLAQAPTNALWHAHKKRAKAHVEAMKTGLPHPQTALFDRYALRVPLMLALATTIGLQAARLKPGVVEAFSFYKAGDISSLRIDAWVTPPLYTGQPPVILVDGAKPIADNQVISDQTRPIKVPELSEIVIRVSGPAAQKTRLELQQPTNSDSDQNSIKSPKSKNSEIIVKQENGVLELRAKLTSTVDAKLHLEDRLVKNWHFTIAKDHPPAITYTKKPQASPRGSLRISYRVADDYGVVEATAHITKSSAEKGSIWQDGHRTFISLIARP